VISVAGREGPVLASTVAGPESALELAPPARDLLLLGELAALTGDDRGVAPELAAEPRPPAGPRGPGWRLASLGALAALALLLAEGGVAVVVERLAARRAAERAFRS
jgi:hypothetical protein